MKKRVIRRKLLLVLAVIASTIYILWRIFFTIPLEYGMVAFIAGLALVTAELVGVIEAFSHYRNMSGYYEPEKPDIPIEWYPTVDVFVATHNEPVELLYKTINACKYMKYPDRNKVNIYICDDNNRDEMKQLAKRLGVKYSGVIDNKHAKAGNLNHALTYSDGVLIATFDADMIPRSCFLMETVPYFLLPKMKKNEEGIWVPKEGNEIKEDEKVGFVQTPQSFYNADLFQFNFYAEQNIPNEQDYFFKDVNVGRNRTNSPIYAGSNTLISREALTQVGGITTGNITEDFATGIKIQEQGYTCYATSKPLAHGLAPIDFKGLIKQRQRWGRGCVQTIRSFKFLFGGLTLRSKLSYMTCFLYWWTFVRRFIYILSPILFTVFGVVIVDCSLIELLFIWLPSYLIYNQTLRMLSGKIRDQKWSNIVDTIIFPYMMIPILAETIGLKLKKFAVTPKVKSTQKNTDIRYAIPHIILAGGNLVGLVMCILDMIHNQSLGNIIILYWLLLNGYFLTMAIIFMSGRINYRNDERFYVKVPAVLRNRHNVFEGMTSDLSEGGIGVILHRPECIPPDEELEIEVEYKDYKCRFRGEIRHVQQLKKGWKYSIKAVDMDERDRREYLQIVYDRDHTLSNYIYSHLIKDVATATTGKIHHSYPSNRRLPRIPMDIEVKTISGDNVNVINYNYEYILLKGIYKVERIELNINDCYKIKCIPEKQNEQMEYTLCKIENWKALAREEALQYLLIPDRVNAPITHEVGEVYSG